MRKHKGLYLLVSLALCFTLSACNASTQTEKVYLEQDEIASLYTNPNNYKGKYVKLTGQVFNVEKSGEEYYYQVWHDCENVDDNTIIYSKDKVELEDYVKIDGLVNGEYKGQNMLGDTISAPEIISAKIQKVTPQEVLAPAYKTVDTNINQDNNGVTICIDKIEFAKSETRVHFKVENKSSDKISLSIYDSVIVQDSKQYETNDSRYQYDKEMLPYDVTNDVVAEGILVYQATNPDSTAQIKLEAYSDCFDQYKHEFIFEYTPEK